MLKGFDKTVEGAFMSLISIPPYHEIVEYKSGEGISSIIPPIEPFQLYGEETNYNEKYMEYLTNNSIYSIAITLQIIQPHVGHRLVFVKHEVQKISSQGSIFKVAFSF